MTSIWKLFYYSPQKAEALKGIQAVLGFPELKIVKPSDIRWLSHERCVKAICNELPPLLLTLSQLYESSGNAEVYGIYSLLAVFFFLFFHVLATRLRSPAQSMPATISCRCPGSRIANARSGLVSVFHLPERNVASSLGSKSRVASNTEAQSTRNSSS